MARRKRAPESEQQEAAFWQDADTVDHIDWSKAVRVRMPNLKPSTSTISLRLPDGLLDELKILANQRDVPYQSLLKVFLAERLTIERERKQKSLRPTRPQSGKVARAPAKKDA